MNYDSLISLLVLAFTAWAGVVGYIGVGIRKDLKEVSRELNMYILSTEKRLAYVEARLGFRHVDGIVTPFAAGREDVE